MKGLFLPLVAVLVCGCATFKDLPASQAVDVGAAVSCTRAQWGQPWTQVVSACFAQDSKLASDVIADLELLFQARTAPTTPDAGGVSLPSSAILTARPSLTLSTLSPNPYAAVPSVAAALSRKSAPR
jgi:hypothetical protein